MSGYYVLKCHLLHHESAKKNRTALSLITQAWRRDELAPASRHGNAGPLQSLWLFEKFNYTLKGTGNACGQNGAQSKSHPSQWECVTFPWTLNGVGYSRQAVPVAVMCMFNPPTRTHPLPFPPPPTPLPFGLCFLHCVLCRNISVWVRTIPGQALQQHVQLSKGEKNRKESPVVASFQRKSTANYSTGKALLLWCPQCNEIISM